MISRICLSLAALTLIGCAGGVSSNFRDSTMTAAGVQISFNGCWLSSEFDGRGNLTLYGIRLTEQGRDRPDPKFALAKSTVTPSVVREADYWLKNLLRRYDWICSKDPGQSKERRAYFDRFRNDALAAYVDTALRLEKLQTDDQFLQEFERVKALSDGFTQREPESVNSH